MVKKSFVSLFLLGALSGIVSGEELQLKFRRYEPATPDKYPEYLSGSGKTDSVEGHDCLVVDSAYANPLVMKTPECIKKGQGSIRFLYMPRLAEPGKGKLLIQTLIYSTTGKGNSVLIGVNNYGLKELIPMFLIDDPAAKLVNYGPYRTYDLSQNRWHTFEASWDREKMILLIDGNLSDSKELKKGQVIWGDTLSIGGRTPGYPYTSPGLIADITFSDQPVIFSGKMPLAMTQSVPGTHRDLQRLKDTKEGFFFIFESPDSPAEITVAPSIFTIRKGDVLWVENTGGISYETTAAKDGELTLKSRPTLFSQVMISHTTPNAAKNLSFEVRKVTGDLQFLRDELPTGLYGHPEWESKGEVVGRPVGEVVLQTTRDGAAMAACSRPVKVRAGARYLASTRYFTAGLAEGNQIFFEACVTDDRGKQYFSRDYVYRRNSVPDGMELSFPFTAPADYQNPRCRLLVAAAGKPFQVKFSHFDLRPDPVRTYKIPRALTAEQSAPAVDETQLQEILAQRKPSVPGTAKINGRTVFTLNGKPAPYLAYYAFPNQRGCKQFLEDGVNVQYLYWVASFGDKKFWLGPGQYDFAAVDRHLKESLLAAPNAEFMLALELNPYEGFTRRHPDAVSRNHLGQKMITYGTPGTESPGNPYCVFYLSPDYLREVSAMIRALCDHLKQSPYGKAVIGVHLLGGGDGQWFRIADTDRSPDSLKAYRQYLKEQYHGDLEAFRKAWGDNSLTFDTADFAPPMSGTSRYFMDPNLPADRRAMDMYNYRNYCTEKVITFLAETFKQAMDRPFWVSAYYNDGSAKNDLGKDRLMSLLDNPNLDGTVSVIGGGGNHLPGETDYSNAHLASYDLHGKKHRLELDYRTPFSNYDQRGYGYDRDTVGASQGHAEHLAQLERDLGQALAANQGAWFFSLAGLTWADDAFRSHIREAVAAAKKTLNAPSEEHPPMAVFLDDNTTCYSHINYFVRSIEAVSMEFLRYCNTSGLGFDSYELGDLLHPQLPKYRIYVFPRAPHLSEEQIAFIEKNLQKDGNILVFAFDVARLTGKMEENIRRLTGIKVKTALNKEILYRNQPGAVRSKLGKAMDFFPAELVAPLIYVDDPAAEKLAVFKQNPGLVSAAMKRHKNWTAVYSAAPQAVTAEFLNRLAQAHRITPTAEPGDTVHCGNRVIAFHAITGGVKTIHWDKVCDLEDLGSGEIVAKQATSYSFKLKAGESRWFRKK